MKYSVDTSALLDGWKRHYPPDVFESIWKKIESLVRAGVLVAAEEVLFELRKKDDDVLKWAEQHSVMFVPPEEDQQKAVISILRNHPKLIDTRRGRSGADPFVVALARTRNLAVLTGERPSQSIERPNIPDVCDALGIRWLNLVQLFREQAWVI